TSIETKKVQESLVATASMAGSKTHATGSILGMTLKKLVPGFKKARGSKTIAERLTSSNSRPYMYVFPPLDDCRKAFESVMGLTIDWPDDDDSGDDNSRADEKAKSQDKYKQWKY